MRRTEPVQKSNGKGRLEESVESLLGAEKEVFVSLCVCAGGGGGGLLIVI